jgi:AcrR family transcriptional regulator
LRKKINKNTNLKLEESATRLLNQAIKLFLKRGYHGTSIEDITWAAGLTKGAFYCHFKSKEDILKRIVEEFERRFLDETIEAVNKVRGGFLDKFEKYIRHNAAFAYYNRELCVSFTTLAAELVGDRTIIEREIRRIYKRYQKFLSKLIVMGKKEGFFRRDLDTHLASLVIISFHDGTLLQWSMNRKNIDGKSFLNTFRRIMLNGVVPFQLDA